MRKSFTRSQLYASGIIDAHLRRSLIEGTWQRVGHGLYCEGSAPVTDLERALALLEATEGVASHSLAAWFYELDGVKLSYPFVSVARDGSARRAGIRRHTYMGPEVVSLNGCYVTAIAPTLVDVGAKYGAAVAEQALESALRRRLTTIAELEAYLHGDCRLPGRNILKQVLGVRPLGAPPTESLLETLMVQLLRFNSVPTPTRQVEVFNAANRFVARVDLAYPEFGIFIELDGQHHKGQPVYDASRQTAVVAATGWNPARFTWTEVTETPVTTARRMRELIAQAARHAG